MKNIKMLKKLVIIMLSFVFILVCANNVFAADDDLFTDANFANINGSTTNNTTDGGNTAASQNSSTNSATNNTNTSSLGTNNTSNTGNTNSNRSNTTNSNVNRSVSNTNSLANTGLVNSGGIIALIVVVCGISAIYSYKKVNDYKKL